jgi:CheY-like chemotaxis protein
MNTIKRGLVVDDISSIRYIAKTMLNALGCETVYEASRGKMALELVCEHQLDIVLLDWRLPDMAGIDCLRIIRSVPLTANLPVLMVTAERERSMVQEALEAGASGYIVKPFNLPTLQAHLRKALLNQNKNKA